MTDLLTKRVQSTARRLLAGEQFVLPEGLSLYFEWFGALNATRSFGFSGPLAISFQEIESWARLMRWPLEPHHVALIRAIDREWMRKAHQQAGPTNDLPRQTGATRSINPAAFDAVFA